ncbi:hypothetical protein B0O80DRAFT_107725 [Mortierella sp. GBAus27b]|nr:hypothetical protein B0O80DRAFT_107725 [Mortierella sp. GBAus27b]
MVKSLSALLLLACAAVGYAGCVNRGPQNSLAYIANEGKCVRSCGECEGLPCEFSEECLDKSGGQSRFQCISDDARTRAPAPDRVFSLETRTCVEDCDGCQGHCFPSPAECIPKSEGRFVLVCITFDARVRTPAPAPVHSFGDFKCVLDCRACQNPEACFPDPGLCFQSGFPGRQFACLEG